MMGRSLLLVDDEPGIRFGVRDFLESEGLEVTDDAGIDTSELLAYLQIPQGELAKFAAGQAATLVVDAMPNTTYSATIARISPTIDVRNGTFRATAFVDNRSGELAPGMFARFSIAYDRHADALVIPRAAIVEEDDQASIYVVANGSVARLRM